jgi:uncharacterized membrane protein YidH (DUF202 family)
MRVEKPEGIDSNVFGEVQLILAEKRTALSAMRTGIAVFALPLSVLSVLVATSKYYDVLHVLQFLIPLLILSLALIVLGSYLVLHSVWRIRHHDRLIKELKLRYSAIAEYID